MSRSPLALAALATVAIPGLKPVACKPLTSSTDFDVAQIIDAENHQWAIKAPRSVLAGAALEGEVALLEILSNRELGLPFAVPRPRGFSPLPEGGRAMLFPQIPGQMLNAARLGAIAPVVAQAISAIHALPTGIIDDAGMPVFSSEEFRERRLAELDEAAATGHVPASLLSRWEEACEDVRLWRFAPTVVHGDLSPEHILIDELQVSAVIEWASAHVGDPAQDLAPLVAQASEFAMDLFLDSYTEARGVDDEFLLARTVLASELALLRWLMHGVRSDEPEVISDAVGMLNELAELTYDSPPIAQIGMMVEPEPLPAPPPPPPPPVEAEPAAPEELFEAVDSPEQPAPVVEDIDSGELAHPVVNTEESAHTNGNSALEAEPPDRFEAGSEDDTVDFGETLLPSSPLEDDGSNPPVKSAANPDSGAIKLTEDPPGADHFFDGDDMPTIEIPRKDL